MKHVVYLLLVVNVIYFTWSMVSGEEDVVKRLPPLPESVQPLVTLEEMQTAEAEKLEEMMAEQPPGAGVSLSCQLLGPFLVIEDLQPVRERLGGSGVEARELVREEQVPAGYWVYMPAMEREAALAIREKLDAAGDSDYYIGQENFISLGAFKERGRAEVRLEQVKGLGLEAVIEPRLVDQTTHWLELDDGVEGERIAGILEEFPGIEQTPAACSSIAGADPIP